MLVFLVFASFFIFMAGPYIFITIYLLKDMKKHHPEVLFSDFLVFHSVLYRGKLFPEGWTTLKYTEEYKIYYSSLYNLISIIYFIVAMIVFFAAAGILQASGILQSQ